MAQMLIAAAKERNMREGIAFSDEELLELARLGKRELIAALREIGFGRIHARNAANLLGKHYAHEASARDCLSLKSELVGIWRSQEARANAIVVLARDHRYRHDVAFVVGEVTGGIEVGVSVHRRTELKTERGVYLVCGMAGKGKVSAYHGMISVGRLSYKNGRLKDLAARSYTKISARDADVESALSAPPLS